MMHLRRRLASVHPDHKRIARSALWVSLFVLLGKSAGAFKEMAIAYRYGVGDVVDAYQLTLTITSWLPGTIASVLGVILVPVFVRTRRLPAEQRFQFLAELQGVGIIVGLSMALGVYFAWGEMLTVFNTKLSAETITMSHDMAKGMSCVAIFMLLISINSARLQACERHINTLLECIPAAVLLVWILLTPDARSLTPLIWGTGAGFVLQALCLGMLASRADRVRSGLRLGFSSPEWPSMYRAFGAFTAGQILMSLVTPLDQYFVADLGEGAIATLGYANRLLGLLLSMGPLAIGRATLPVFAGILNGATPWKARSTALKWSVGMFALGLTVAAVGWIAAREGVELVFQRGAFTPQDSIAVSAQLRWGLIQVPFYFAVLVLVQLLASEGRFKAMALIAVANFATKILANFCLVRWQGLAGISMATALMYATSLSLYVLVVMRNQTTVCKSP